MANTTRTTAPPGRLRHRPQRRAILLLEVAGRKVDLETSVPTASRHIDALLEPGRASRLWGPLRQEIEGRPLVVEPFSRPPGAGQRQA